MKTLVAIAGCRSRLDRMEAQRDTWAFERKEVSFFVGKDFLSPFRYVGWCCTVMTDDSYEGLPEKVREICRLACEMKYDRLFKTDDDTYVSLDVLLRMPYVEYEGNVRGATGGYPADYPSGFGYWLGKKAIEVIANASLTADKNEDRWVGNTLAKANIKPVHNPLMFRHVYPGLEPETLWQPWCRVRDAAVFAQYPADKIRQLHEWKGKLYA